ncbi:MAG: STAS domain-containing protein [Deltaproteobacteria bacterium]|jgi:anti-anti-sigma factor|nr:STAS domain-containing protein [Deltaproteobacteria bacterium]
MISHEVDNGIYRVRVDGEMTIYHALEHKQALLECLGHCTEMEIDLSGVSEMDTTGFQLLVLAKREAVRSGRPLRLVKHSPATLEVMDMFHMAAYFGDPVVMPG